MIFKKTPSASSLTGECNFYNFSDISTITTLTAAQYCCGSVIPRKYPHPQSRTNNSNPPKLYKLLIFSDKWLKMLPPAAVHSFNPRRHLVEELYGHQPLLCSALFITQRLSSLWSFALCYFHSERKNRKLICTVVLHGEQKWSCDKIIQL